MKIDLKGRVNNTKLAHSNSLLPLFEAIVNSIHAVEDAGERGGRIDVFILRDDAQGVLQPEDLVSHPIHSFFVEDNGIGFTERNYQSFNTSDSTHKASRGGKGIGRLLWLKAFQKAEVNSVYNDGAEYWQRSFRFTLSEEGVDEHKALKAAAKKRHTKVALLNYRQEFKDKCPRAARVIAKRVIEHCLEYFVLGDCPRITLHDVNEMEVLDLNRVFDEEIRPRISSQAFLVKEQPFTVTHLRVATGYETQHRLHFCAHKRAVLTESLAGKVPNLSPALREDGEDRPFVYVGYVSGAYLDDSVTADRTSFFSYDREELDFGGGITWQQLVDESVDQAAAFLAPYTDPVKEAKEQQIRSYVQNRAPQYRPLIKHKSEALNAVPPNLSDERLDIELYKINQTYETELRQKYQSLMANEETKKEPEEFDRKFDEFIQEWNEVGMAKLAKHVAHRKATLSFLEASLGHHGEDNKYKLENAIHRIIFPLRKTSDDVRADQMNLWILDEKLAYHHYLASDMPFKDMEGVVDVESKDRPDLLIFHGTAAFTDTSPPFNSLTLIEFKRPARNNYDDDENPIRQVYKYVREIKAGKALDRKGRPLSIPPHTPIYAYIVCDPTPKLREHAENAQLTPTPDASGYFGYNSNHGVYVEVISFDKLVGDARKRNAVLFEQLGLLN